MRVRYVVYGLALAVFVLWSVWAARWSGAARNCFAKGGTSFDSLGWSCYKESKREELK